MSGLNKSRTIKIEEKTSKVMQQIPAAYKDSFENGIRHPELYLWDAWSYIESGTMHLYSLAIPRVDHDGRPLQPKDRDNLPFHIRHFTSENNGKTWQDEGCFMALEPHLKQQGYHTIWSGSVNPLSDGRKLVAITALDVVDDDHNYLQNIALAISDDGYEVDKVAKSPLSAPRRDWNAITNKGYYLDVPANLGSNKGEENGPILAWRDPFIFFDPDGGIHLFWGGKISPTEGALVRAELQENGDLFEIKELAPPVSMPDGEEFTQLEVPKVVYDKNAGLYYLMISTCNRMDESQPDSELEKEVRMYRSKGIDGPWESLGDNILGTQNLFGPTILLTDFENKRLLCIAPYTDAPEDKDLWLTFSSVFYVYLDTLRVEFL